MIRANISTKIHTSPFVRRLKTDKLFHTKVSLFLSLLGNLIYAIAKLILGLMLASIWMSSIAFYYLFLAFAQSCLSYHLYKTPTQLELRKAYLLYRRTAYQLLGITMIVLLILMQMIWQKQTYHYPGILIYGAATYAFVRIGITCKDIVQYRSYRNPIISAVKALRLTSALISILALQTAMLTEFSTDAAFTLFMNACSGTGILLLILLLSIYMIYHANHALQAIHHKH